MENATVDIKESPTQDLAKAAESEPDQNKQQKSPFKSEEVIDALISNEDGDAMIFIKLFRNRFRYDHADAIWYEYKENYWVQDEVDEVTAAIKGVVEIYSQKLGTKAWEREKENRKVVWPGRSYHEPVESELKKRIRDLQSSKRKANILRLARAGKDSLGISGNEWDLDPMKLGCLNGVIDLRDASFRPGRPEDYIKTYAPAAWEGIDASCPKFEETLGEIFDEDHQLIKFLQRLFGYSITGLNSEHILPIFYGIGRNGKDTLLEVLRMVLKDLAGPIQSEMLVKQTFVRSSGSPSSDIIGLRGKRIVWASEMDEGRGLNAGKVKWLVGGGTLTGRAPYARRETSFTPTHTLFLLTNDKPEAPGSDYALWKRVILIPFPISFVDDPKEPFERQRNPQLIDELKREAPGILAWLVKGCLEWQEHGLEIPEAVKMATVEYQQDEDIIGHFIDDCCVVEKNGEIQASVLYKAYNTWCGEMGHNPVNATRFGKQLKKCFDSNRKDKGVFYQGVRLEGVKLV